ncbi:MAG: NAD(P)-dependent oxidoreductase [Spirochaetales bacterium]|nr:NAD(P)-dependent oxidoreductase [Spirochaetales bacterium]
MAVFITGGYGHIGSWMARQFALAGENVIVYDSSPDPPDYLENVSELVEYVRGDVMDLPRLEEVFGKRGKDIDGVVHTVGIMGEFVADDPYRSVKLNVMGTLNVLEIARRFETRKVLYVSTGAVYSAAEKIGSEHDNLPTPADLYAATKLCSESLGLQYGESFGLDFRVGRVYFIYGPGKLPSNFVRLYRVAFGALQGLPDPGADRGADQKLDFTYVEDAARGLAMIYQAPSTKHRIYNIATGRATSVGRVAELAAKYSTAGVRYRIGSGTLMPRCEALDISRAESEFGYGPQVALEEGIRRYAQWLEGNPAPGEGRTGDANRRDR